MNKWIEIDLKLIKRNVAAIKKTLKKETKFMAVVKADAYGHGAIKVSNTALRAGADLLGVLSVDEAIILRKAGIKADITVLAPSLLTDIDKIKQYRLIPTADSLKFLKALNKKSSVKKPQPYYLDIDFGLKRWGINPNDFLNFFKKALTFKNIKISAISTHIDYVPPKNMTEAEEKLSQFKKLGDAAKTLAPGILLHAANSSILCDFPHWQLNMVRIGNLIYGLYPSKIYLEKTKGAPIKGIERPWKFYSKIISIKTASKGESLGYSSEFVAVKKMKIATIATGYGDGLTMEPTDKSIKLSSGFSHWGIIKGHKAPFIGKSGICHTLLDISDIGNVKIGDKVLLPVRRTGASQRIPRIYR
ncbi:MAG: alanine racemase [Elusimicrobiales bacterium]|nr:alanine racemase [Elusimicrobiales bacterium]MCK5106807.1 alanine racemase [Elusimicrobiales bacterium]